MSGLICVSKHVTHMNSAGFLHQLFQLELQSHKISNFERRCRELSPAFCRSLVLDLQHMIEKSWKASLTCSSNWGGTLQSWIHLHLKDDKGLQDSKGRNFFSNLAGVPEKLKATKLTSVKFSPEFPSRRRNRSDHTRKRGIPPCSTTAPI